MRSFHPPKLLQVLVSVLALAAAPATAFQMVETSMQELSDLSVIEFESSFCEVRVGDTVTVNLSVALGDELSDAATATIVAASVKSRNGATPNRGKKKGGDRTATIDPLILAGSRAIDVTLTDADDSGKGWHTVHVRLELSTGDKLGVNLHSTPCEPEDGGDGGLEVGVE